MLPTRGMDNKLKQASADITGFYEHRFPSEYSAMSEELGKLASENNVHFAAVKYDEKDAPIDGLRKVEHRHFALRRLPAEVKFINALERDKMFFLVDGVALGEQQGNVRLQLKLETYMPGTAVSS